MKKATDIIIDLQDKNAMLRLALGKLIEICDNTKIKDVSEIWQQKIGYAKEIMLQTDPNNKTKC